MPILPFFINKKAFIYLFIKLGQAYFWGITLDYKIDPAI